MKGTEQTPAMVMTISMAEIDLSPIPRLNFMKKTLSEEKVILAMR